MFDILKNERLDEVNCLRGVYTFKDGTELPIYLDLEQDEKPAKEEFEDLLSEHLFNIQLIMPKRIQEIKEEVAKGLLEAVCHQTGENYSADQFKQDLQFIELGIHKEADVNIYFGTSEGKIVVHMIEDMKVDDFYFM